jgi:ribosomal-protein-serine acetyltransferase
MFRIPLGDDLHLEKIETRHAEPLFEVIERHRVELKPFAPWSVMLFTLGEVRERIAYLREWESKNAHLSCVLWHGSDLVGMVSVQEIDWENLSASIGLWIAPPAQRRGIASRAVRGIADYAFEALALEQLLLRCPVENLACRRLAARLGWRYEGLSRRGLLLGDSFYDCETYAVIAPDWRGLCERIDRFPVRPARPADEAWMAALADGPRRAAVPGLRLVVERFGFADAHWESSVAEITRLAVAPGREAELVVRRLLESAEAELRVRGAAIVTARPEGTLSPADLEGQSFSPLPGELWVKGLR